MKILRNNIIVILAIVSFTTLKAQDYTINNEQSMVNWIGKAAFSSYAPKGTLQTKSGTLTLNEKTVTNLTLVIDMKSLHHDNKDLKSHLRNKDFFEVKKYTKATFTLLESAAITDGKIALIGDLTIKNSTNRERILVTTQQSANQFKILYEMKLDRTKYGVKFNSPSFFKKLKENAIADDFTLKGMLVFNKI